MMQESFKSLFVGRMGCVLAAALSAGLMAGCSTTPKASEAREHVDEVFDTPTFLNTHAAVLFTNWTGFTGRMEVRTPAQGEKGKMGQLIGRADRLLYAPDPVGGKVSKKRAQDRTSFIWYAADAKGYVVNDSLQGYAALANAARPVSVVVSESSATAAEIDGHRCRPVDVVVKTDSGSEAGFTVWRASDLQGFPMQVKSRDGQLTLSFSKVRFQEPPAELFLPPEEYSKHSSPALMLGALLERQLAVKKKVNLDEWDATHPETPQTSRNPR